MSNCCRICIAGHAIIGRAPELVETRRPQIRHCYYMCLHVQVLSEGQLNINGACIALRLEEWLEEIEEVVRFRV